MGFTIISYGPTYITIKHRANPLNILKFLMVSHTCCPTSNSTCLCVLLACFSYYHWTYSKNGFSSFSWPCISSYTTCNANYCNCHSLPQSSNTKQEKCETCNMVNLCIVDLVTIVWVKLFDLCMGFSMQVWE